MRPEKNGTVLKRLKPDSVRRVGNFEPFQALLFSKFEARRRKSCSVVSSLPPRSEWPPRSLRLHRLLRRIILTLERSRKMPVGEGAAGAAKKGIEGEAGAAKKGIIEKITEAIGGGEEEMHPPKYKALEDSVSKCVVTGNDCLRHCYGMFSMKDTSMAACANAAFQLV